MALRSCVRPLPLSAGAAARLRGAREGLRFTSAKPSFEVASTEVDTRENEVVAPDFTNRNPRNLEQLALARKERGWETSWPSREFWRRLRFERTQQYVEAFVEDPRGNVIVSASTREWAIKRHLYSPRGVVACKNIGLVLAQRCLEAGINFVEFKAVVPWERRSDSASANLLTLGVMGILLHFFCGYDYLIF